MGIIGSNKKNSSYPHLHSKSLSEVCVIYIAHIYFLIFREKNAPEAKKTVKLIDFRQNNNKS